MGTVLLHLPKISEKTIHSINLLPQKSYKNIIMKGLFLCASILCIANISSGLRSFEPEPRTDDNDCPHDCFIHCLKKYGGFHLRGNAYMCIKGCAGVNGGKVQDPNKYCCSRNFGACKDNCRLASSSQANIKKCEYGCTYWIKNQMRPESCGDVEYTLISVGPYQNFCPEGTEPIYSEKQCKDLAMDCQERESPRCKVKFSNLKQESGDQIGKDIDGLTWKYSGSRRGSTKGCQIWLHQNRGYIYFNTHKTGGVPKSASAPRDRLCLKGKWTSS